MKKIVFILTLLLICAISCYLLWTKVLWKTFACSVAGSYECVQTWRFEVSESDLIEIIHEVKKEHPELEVPNYCCEIELKHDYWYDVTFYYKDTNEDVQTWIRSDDIGHYSTFALVAISAHNNANASPDSFKLDVKEINRDYEYFENRKEIQKFEEKIIKLLKEKIDKR